MADRFSTPVDFNNVPVTNLKLPTVASDKSSPNVGETFFNSTSKQVKVCVASGQTRPLARIVTATIGDGSATSYAITHNLNTTDVDVTSYVISTGVNSGNITSITRTSANVVTIVYGAAPSSNSVKVVIVG